MTSLDKLMIMLGYPCECSEETAEMCLSMARDAVLDCIGRDELPKGAENIAVKLAVIYYNRLGNEGETSRSEGGISQSFCTDIPAAILRQLQNYPRKVGVIRCETDEE